MQIDLTPEQDDLIRWAIETGRLNRPADAVQEALALGRAREEARRNLAGDR